jgi:hypothetical protein
MDRSGGEASVGAVYFTYGAKSFCDSTYLRCCFSESTSGDPGEVHSLLQKPSTVVSSRRNASGAL